MRKSSGFTLIEVLVAAGILVFVVTIVSGIYLTTVSAQRRTFDRQDVLDSSRFALESMARAIRQSTVSGGAGSTLTLEDHPTKGSITYALSDTRLVENGDPITADDVTVDSLSFIVGGVGSGDGEQPRVTIVLEVRSRSEKQNEEAAVPIQTTVTPRGLEL